MSSFFTTFREVFQTLGQILFGYTTGTGSDAVTNPGMISQFLETLESSPVLIVCFALGLVGLAVGLIQRLSRLNA